jgi:hypothetical protein
MIKIQKKHKYIPIIQPLSIVAVTPQNVEKQSLQKPHCPPPLKKALNYNFLKNYKTGLLLYGRYSTLNTHDLNKSAIPLTSAATCKKQIRRRCGILSVSFYWQPFILTKKFIWI